MILLPGLDGTGILFEPLIAALPADFRTQVIRFPGDRRLSYDELLASIRNQLPRGEPWVLLGESFSGPLAIRLAAESPEELKGLILVATFVRKPVRWLPQWVGPLLPSLAFRLAPLCGQLRLLTSGKATPELRRLFRAALSEVQPAVLAHRVSEVLRVEVTRELRQVRVPILVIAAKRDRTVPGHNLALLRQLRPDANVLVIDGDHLVLQVEPEQSAEGIRQFVAAL